MAAILADLLDATSSSSALDARRNRDHHAEIGTQGD